MDFSAFLKIEQIIKISVPHFEEFFRYSSLGNHKKKSIIIKIFARYELKRNA
jgi:hypothetical protein